MYCRQHFTENYKKVYEKSFRKCMSNIPGKYEIKELQKNSHIGHCTHTTESGNVKVQNIFHGRNNTICTTNCKYRRAATAYTYPWNLVCFRYINANTLHNGDNKDNDVDNNNNNVTLKSVMNFSCESPRFSINTTFWTHCRPIIKHTIFINLWSYRGVQFQYHVRPSGIYSGQSGIRTVCSPNFGFSCHYYSTKGPHSLIHPSPTLSQQLIASSHNTHIRHTNTHTKTQTQTLK